MQMFNQYVFSVDRTYLFIYRLHTGMKVYVSIYNKRIKNIFISSFDSNE